MSDEEMVQKLLAEVSNHASQIRRTAQQMVELIQSEGATIRTPGGPHFEALVAGREALDREVKAVDAAMDSLASLRR